MDTRLVVQWNAYQKNICNGFSILQQRGEYVDMTLAADGHHVQVHKVVLCLVSPYIKELIAATKCSHPVIFLNNVSSTTLEHILEYVYTGEALVPRHNIKEFLQACKALNIKGLENTLSVEQYSEAEKSTSQWPGGGGAGAGGATGNTRSDPIATTVDDGHNDDDFEVIDQEMETNNKSGAVITSTKINSNNPQQRIITNTIASNALSGNETQVQYTISVHGQLQIVLNRYLYSFHYIRNRTDDMVWRCLANRESKCPATVIIKDGKVVRRLRAHNHPFADKNILKRLRKGLVYSELKEAQNAMEERKKKGNTSSNISNDDND